jgi:ABC-type transport system involved in multi-copper enzyme maturation permease subunit
MSSKPIPSTPQAVFAIGKVTLQEIIRDHVLYNVILCGVILVFMSLLASHLMILHPERVLVDFGLAAVTLSCSMIGIFIGASTMTKEVERRTIYVTLSHPISRWQFVLGKFAGLCGVIFLNALLLIGIFFLLLFITPNSLSLLSIAFFYALILAVLQSLLLTSIALFFSIFTTTSLSVICSIGLFLIGSNLTPLMLLAAKSSHWGFKLMTQSLQIVIPHFSSFNLSEKVTYALDVSPFLFLTSTGYGICFIFFFLFLSSWFLTLKEL